MAWYVGAFKKMADDESLVRQLSTAGIDEDFIREVWSLSEGDPVFGAAYNITSENVGRVQDHVTEKIDLSEYAYQLFDEYD